MSTARPTTRTAVRPPIAVDQPGAVGAVLAGKDRWDLMLVRAYPELPGKSRRPRRPRGRAAAAHAPADQEDQCRRRDSHGAQRAYKRDHPEQHSASAAMRGSSSRALRSASSRAGISDAMKRGSDRITPVMSSTTTESVPPARARCGRAEGESPPAEMVDAERGQGQKSRVRELEYDDVIREIEVPGARAGQHEWVARRIVRGVRGTGEIDEAVPSPVASAFASTV